MKLEVGMYVRTKEGNIEKICDIENEHIYTDEDYLSWYPSSNAISKASNNIIDLIEVGDFVNGYKVINVGVEELGHTYLSLDMNEDIHWLESEIENEEQIKSIVTKQQFESMSYKVGE